MQKKINYQIQLKAISPPNSNRCIHFTLIELLTVVAVLAILFSLLFPSLSKSRKMAKRAVCGSNLSQVDRGLAKFIRDNNGFYPYGRNTANNYSWEDYIANYLGSDITHAEKKLKALPKENTIVILQCPSEDYSHISANAIKTKALRSFRVNNYRKLQGNFGVFSQGPPYPSRSLAHIETPSGTFTVSDGGSLYFQGTPSHQGCVGPGVQRLYDSTHYNNSKNVLFSDGHVDFISNTEFFPYCDYFKIRP